MREYNATELMACVAGKLLEDGKSVLLGTGLPIIAGVFAQRTHAPNLLIVFEAGAIGPLIPALPVSVGDSRTFHKAIMSSSMHDIMSLAQRGYLDFGFLGAAQIDCYGNINTTVIGPYQKPKVRLPGSGGANDVGSFCQKTIILMKQDAKRFVEKIDFITTPGYLSGPGAREKAGLAEGSGPYRVVTQFGVYDFDETTKRMRLLAVHPGIKIEDVQANSQFKILMPEEIGVTEPPTPKELEILRQADPLRICLGK